MQTLASDPASLGWSVRVIRYENAMQAMYCEDVNVDPESHF